MTTCSPTWVSSRRKWRSSRPSSLIEAVEETIKRRGLSQTQAARLCGTDQPTLSKVLRGRMESVTIDRLAAWLVALGRIVEIRVPPYEAGSQTGRLVAMT